MTCSESSLSACCPWWNGRFGELYRHYCPIHPSLRTPSTMPLRSIPHCGTKALTCLERLPLLQRSLTKGRIVGQGSAKLYSARRTGSSHGLRASGSVRFPVHHLYSVDLLMSRSCYGPIHGDHFCTGCMAYCRRYDGG